MVKDFTNSNVKRVGLLTMLALPVVAAAILISPKAIFADGSTARFGAGGIEFLKSEDIRMLEEVLEISTKLIRVRFRFLNESGKDIHATMAFPLPLYPSFLIDRRSGIGHPADSIMDSFTVRIDGHLVSPKIDRKAILNNGDITAQLREIGLSEAQIFAAFELTKYEQAAMERLDEKKRALLQSNWEISETAFWQQTFPAGKEIVVEHTYKPAVGSFPDAWFGTWMRRKDDEVCLHDVTAQAIENRVKALDTGGDGMVNVRTEDVEYILSTGRNWKGPIRKFTLRIEKESPDQFVSLCFPEKPKKVRPTVYEFVQKNFVPPDKLVVYFYTVGP
ncbi:MAG: DUF4424 family protein [Desulfomonile tiedjei]|nr:DUF4424 family protein [Desulfomonile tiedjei]